MYKFMFALHLLLAMVTIGPLAHGLYVGAVAVRKNNVGSMQAASRMLGLYAFSTAVVVIAGMGVMSGWGDKPIASINDTWIWLPSLMWVVSVALVLGWIVPALDKASRTVSDGHTAAAFVGRVTVLGATVAVLFTAITVMMIYKPGA